MIGIHITIFLCFLQKGTDGSSTTTNNHRRVSGLDITIHLSFLHLGAGDFTATEKSPSGVSGIHTITQISILHVGINRPLTTANGHRRVSGICSTSRLSFLYLADDNWQSSFNEAPQSCNFLVICDKYPLRVLEGVGEDNLPLKGLSFHGFLYSK